MLKNVKRNQTLSEMLTVYILYSNDNKDTKSYTQEESLEYKKSGSFFPLIDCKSNHEQSTKSGLNMNIHKKIIRAVYPMLCFTCWHKITF